MRTTAKERLTKQAAGIRSDLSPAQATKAVLQLLWLKDVLTSYLAYAPSNWDRAVLQSMIQAADPSNPRLKEFFR